MTTRNAELAVILGRVSTEDQAEDGTGLPGQIEAGLAHIARCGYQLDTSIGYASEGIEYVPGVFQEDYTGKVIYRPAVNHLLDALAQRAIRVIVIHRTSRLGRRGSVQEALESIFAQHGARIEYVTAKFDTGTPIGRAMRRMSGVFDELDYEQIIDQLREGKAQRVKAGSIVTTRPPYGYTITKERDENGKRVTRLTICEEEARIVRLVFEWYVYGDKDGKPLSVLAISKRLTEMRIATRGDAVKNSRKRTPPASWVEPVIHRMLANETYVGRWYYRKTKSVSVAGRDRARQVPTDRSEWLCVQVPAIIDDHLFKAAREKAVDNAANARRNRRFTYLFTAMAKCGRCNSSFCGGANNNRQPKRYRCTGTNPKPIKICTMPTYSEAELDAEVWPWIKDIATHFDRVEAALQQQQSDTNAQNARINALIANTDRLIAEKKAEQDRLLMLYQKGNLKEERWVVADALCEREITSHHADREKLIAKLVKPHYTPEYLADVREACKCIALGIEHFDEEQKREAYELLELSLILAVEDGMKVAHAECILGKKLLTIGKPGFIASQLW